MYHVLLEAFTEAERAALSESIQSHLGQSYECHREHGLAGRTDNPEVLVISLRAPIELEDEAAIRTAVRNAARNFGTLSGEAMITLLRMPEKTVLEHLCRIADVTGFADCESDE